MSNDNDIEVSMDELSAISDQFYDQEPTQGDILKEKIEAVGKRKREDAQLSRSLSEQSDNLSNTKQNRGDILRKKIESYNKEKTKEADFGILR